MPGQERQTTVSSAAVDLAYDKMLVEENSIKASEVEIKLCNRVARKRSRIFSFFECEALILQKCSICPKTAQLKK